MRHFRFKLVRVLEWQQRVCQEEEEKLHAHQLALLQTDQHIEQAKADSTAAELDALTRSVMSASEIRALARYRTRVAADVRALARKRDEQQKAVNEQRQRVNAERQRAKTLERIRDRALEEHVVAADREMEAISLESYLSTWPSRQVEGGPQKWN